MNVDTRLTGYVFDLILNGEEYDQGVFMRPVDADGMHAIHFSEDVPADVQAEIVEAVVLSCHTALEHE